MSYIIYCDSKQNNEHLFTAILNLLDVAYYGQRTGPVSQMFLVGGQTGELYTLSNRSRI